MYITLPGECYGNAGTRIAGQCGLLAQLVEHIVHIDGVTGSSPVSTTKILGRKAQDSFLNNYLFLMESTVAGSAAGLIKQDFLSTGLIPPMEAAFPPIISAGISMTPYSITFWRSVIWQSASFTSMGHKSEFCCDHSRAELKNLAQ